MSVSDTPQIETFQTETGTASINMIGARTTAWEYLYGKQSHRLSDEDWFYVYSQADGFGDTREGAMREWLAEYVSQGTDWSHVRDSSPQGLARVLAAIIERQKG